MFGKRFGMKTMKDYHDLYLKCDVLLVAVFENFSYNSLKKYGLCPSHYLSIPASRLDAMLKITKIELELIPDPDMHIFFEKGTRGGISYISNRHSQASKKYLKSYDPKQSIHYILRIKTLYTLYLSTSGFKWIDAKDFDLNKYTSNSSKGYVLEVDLEYPKELHKLHNEYPLAPDKIEIQGEMLSEYHLKIADLYNIPIGNVKN